MAAARIRIRGIGDGPYPGNWGGRQDHPKGIPFRFIRRGFLDFIPLLPGFPAMGIYGVDQSGFDRFIGTAGIGIIGFLLAFPVFTAPRLGSIEAPGSEFRPAIMQLYL